MYRVCVHWEGWSKSRKLALLTEYDATRVESKEQARTDSAAQGWLFFVGTQDRRDPSLFYVDHHQLICSMSGVVETPLIR